MWSASLWARLSWWRSSSCCGQRQESLHVSKTQWTQRTRLLLLTFLITFVKLIPFATSRQTLQCYKLNNAVCSQCLILLWFIPFFTEEFKLLPITSWNNSVNFLFLKKYCKHRCVEVFKYMQNMELFSIYSKDISLPHNFSFNFLEKPQWENKNSAKSFVPWGSGYKTSFTSHSASSWQMWPGV